MIETISTKMVKVIRERRLSLGFSQEYMAVNLDMGQNCYSKIELGHNKLTVDRLFAICRLLGLSTEELLGYRSDRSSDFSNVFYLNKHPMWVFEPVTLRFLEVNDAAVRNYGYSRADFMKMDLFDIRRMEYANWLRNEARQLDPSKPYFNTSYHQHKDGTVKEVLINCYPVQHDHGQAYLVKPEIAPPVKSYISQLRAGIFTQDKNKNVANGHARSRFAELRFLSGQLDARLPANVQEDLVHQIKELMKNDIQ